MDFDVIRERLRQARMRAGLTLDQAAAATGRNRATIHSLENIKREPHLKPDLETIERLVVAYRLTLSRFFAQIEGEDLSAAKAAEDDATIAAPTAPRRYTQADIDEGLPPLPSETEITHIVVETLARLLAEAQERASAADHRQAPNPDAAAPRQRRTPRSRHRRAPKRAAKRRLK